MTKTAIEDMKEAEKGDLTATSKELKSGREDEVQTEIQVILEAEVQLKEQGLQKILARGPQSKDFVPRLESINQI